MNGKAMLGRWGLLLLAILLPLSAAVAFACVRWGQFALEAVQVVLKLAVIP